MNRLAKRLDEDGVDANDAVLVVFGLNHISDCDSAYIIRFFEVPGSDRLLAHFIEDGAGVSPLWK